MIHELKTDPDVFQAVYDGNKNWEIRRNDRNFQVGDKLSLRETKSSGAEMRKGHMLQYTGRRIEALVTFILNGPAYGLQGGWCIMSIRVLERN
jgi:hypothetical protein